MHDLCRYDDFTTCGIGCDANTRTDQSSFNFFYLPNTKVKIKPTIGCSFHVDYADAPVYNGAYKDNFVKDGSNNHILTMPDRDLVFGCD